MTLGALLKNIKSHRLIIFLEMIITIIVSLAFLVSLPPRYECGVRVYVEASDLSSMARIAGVEAATKEELKFVLDTATGESVKEAILGLDSAIDIDKYAMYAQINSSAERVDIDVVGPSPAGVEAVASHVGAAVQNLLRSHRDEGAEVYAYADSVYIAAPANRCIVAVLCFTLLPVYAQAIVTAVQGRRQRHKEFRGAGGNL